MSQRLGQHFLKDQNALQKIATALDLKSGDAVIEIGAGHGELTKELKVKSEKIKIIGIERDERLASELKEEISGENIEIITGDALEVLKSISEKLKKYKIAGNIPYYLTGHLLRIIGELENKPEICVLTIQKEVALRITAEPPKMNRLAAAVQFWAEPEIEGFLSEAQFSPAPKVKSAIMKLKTKSEKIKIMEEDYYGLVRILFQQPRKTILNNLAAAREKKWEKGGVLGALKEVGIESGARPQNLSVEEIIKLARILG